MAGRRSASVPDLIAELTDVAHAVQRIQAAADLQRPSIPEPELLSLRVRQRDIGRELRRRRLQWRATFAPGAGPARGRYPRG
jgi:hypothetical protein